MQRNAHSSTIDALVLSGLRPTFAAPELDAELGIAHCLTPETLDGALRCNPERRGRVGHLTDLLRGGRRRQDAGRVAHRRGVPLIVDEAWGAHLAFHEKLPEHALASWGRPGDLEHAQDRRQPHPVGDAPPRPRGRRDDRRGHGRSLRDAHGVDQPQLAAGRFARRGPPPGRGPRTPSCSSARSRRWRRSRERSARSPDWTCSTNGWRGALACSPTTRCGSSIDVRGTGAKRLRARASAASSSTT